ncbi:TetR/AcrR family transcriptional regulator [Streptomyces graminifolii]|uniref:TetR/AcrR family transcriptional regulator n=1 Tax=Streptomyces graminifolii TaxID=1266771 RepID=UPI004059965B
MGRPPGFDKTKVIQLVTRQFRRTGYAGTSMDEIAKVSGLGRGSLYAAFGGKGQLFAQSLADYCEHNEAEWADVLDGPDEAALERLRTYLVKSARVVHDDPERLGCMVTGFVVEGVEGNAAADARAEQAISTIARSLSECVMAAQRNGDLDPAADPVELCHLLMAVNRGMEVLARAGIAQDALERVAARALMALPLTRPS